MPKVKLYHPQIDGGERVISVSESAVSQYLLSGWLRESERPSPPPPADQTTEAPANAGASSIPEPDAETSPPRRRASTTQEDK